MQREQVNYNQMKKDPLRRHSAGVGVLRCDCWLRVAATARQSSLWHSRRAPSITNSIIFFFLLNFHFFLFFIFRFSFSLSTQSFSIITNPPCLFSDALIGCLASAMKKYTDKHSSPHQLIIAANTEPTALVIPLTKKNKTEKKNMNFSVALNMFFCCWRKFDFKIQKLIRLLVSPLFEIVI